jgi:hypothetical protein
MFKIINIIISISFLLFLVSSKFCYPRVFEQKTNLFLISDIVVESPQFTIADLNSKKALTQFETDPKTHATTTLLFRHDLKKGYSIQKTTEVKCISFDISDKIEELCLSPLSKVVGNITIGNNIKCKVIDSSDSIFDNKMLIQDCDVLTPIQSVTRSIPANSFSFFYDYKHFTDVYPDQSVFNIPKECLTAKNSDKKLN